jgi:hypothetical protein
MINLTLAGVSILTGSVHLFGLFTDIPLTKLEKVFDSRTQALAGVSILTGSVHLFGLFTDIPLTKLEKVFDSRTQALPELA